jgi:hypothetical protein
VLCFSHTLCGCTPNIKLQYLNTFSSSVNAIIGIDGLNHDSFPGVYQVIVGVTINFAPTFDAIFFAVYII